MLSTELAVPVSALLAELPAAAKAAEGVRVSTRAIDNIAVISFFFIVSSISIRGLAIVRQYAPLYFTFALVTFAG